MTKLILRRSIKKAALPTLLASMLFLLGCTSLKFVLSHITKIETTSSVGEVSEIILSYISIFVTIILGVVVYQQSDRINRLESTQYSIFLGAEKFDPNIPMGSEFLLLSRRVDKKSCVKVFQIVDPDFWGLLTNISLNEGNQHIELPFLFTTRNVPLITSVAIERIDLSIRYTHDSGRSSFMNSYPVNITPIFRFIGDQSQFPVRFSINGVSAPDIRRIQLVVKFSIKDQLSRNHVIETVMAVEQRYGQFCLLSSKSQCTTE